MTPKRLSASIGVRTAGRLVEGHDAVGHEARGRSGRAAGRRSSGGPPCQATDERRVRRGRPSCARASPGRRPGRSADLASEKQVLGDGQVLGEKDLLVHEHDPLVLGLDRARERNRRILEEQAPLAGRWPERMRMSVDLPAPFSPITAWTSPASSASDTSLRTSMGPRISRRALREVRPWNHPARVQHQISRPRSGIGRPARRSRRPTGGRSDRDGGSHRVSSSNVASPSAERTGPPVSLDGGYVIDYIKCTRTEAAVKPVDKPSSAKKT